MKRETLRTAITRDTVIAWLGSLGISPLSLSFLAVPALVTLCTENEYVLRLVVVSLFLGSQAMAYDFTEGLISICNFGFAGFVGLGAYVSGLLAVELGVSPWIGLLAGTIVAAALGLLTGMLVLPLRGIYATCMTWFLSLALMGVAAAWVDLTRGYLGLNVPFLLESTSSKPYIYVLLVIVAVAYVVLRVVAASHIGLAFRAIGQNLEAARASGIDPTRYKVLNLTLSCGLAGMLGAFYGHFIGVLTPAVMDTKHTMEVLIVSYIGGRGSLWGGPLVALLLVPVFQHLKYLREIRLIIYGGLMMLVMLFYPDGFAGLCRSIGSRALGLFRRRKNNA